MAPRSPAISLSEFNTLVSSAFQLNRPGIDMYTLADSLSASTETPVKPRSTSMFSSPKSKGHSPFSVFRNLFPSKSHRSQRNAEKVTSVPPPTSLIPPSLRPPLTEEVPSKGNEDPFVPYIPLASRHEMATRRAQGDKPDIADDVLGVRSTFPEPPTLVENSLRSETPTPHRATKPTVSASGSPEKVPVAKKDQASPAPSVPPSIKVPSTPPPSPAPQDVAIPSGSGSPVSVSVLEELLSPQASSHDWILSLPSHPPSSFYSRSTRQSKPIAIQWSQASSPNSSVSHLSTSQTKLARRRFRSYVDLRVDDSEVPFPTSGDATPSTIGRTSHKRRVPSPFPLTAPDSEVSSNREQARVSLESLISRSSSRHPFSASTMAVNESFPEPVSIAGHTRADSLSSLDIKPQSFTLDPTRGLPAPMSPVQSVNRRSVATSSSSRSRNSRLGYQRTGNKAHRISGNSSASSWWDSDEEEGSHKARGYHTAQSSLNSFLSFA